MLTSPMIQVKQLGVRFGERQILDQINLTFDQGGFYAIIGPNGCGKTTLFRCISSLLEPSHGEVLLQGKPVSEFTARALAQNIAIVRQQVQTDFEFTALQTVLMGRNPYQHRLQNESQQDLDIVEHCMKQTNTWHLRDAYPSQMSGGELQRVMIARALAQQTPIILLDEPTSNLDIAHQFDIMQLLADVNCAEGKTILIVVHDLNLAYHYCKQLVMLNHGHVEYAGDMQQGLTAERIQEVFGVKACLDNGEIHLSSLLNK